MLLPARSRSGFASAEAGRDAPPENEMGRSLLRMRSTTSISYLILSRRAPCHAFGGRLEGCATGSDDFLATLLERGDAHQDADAADDEGGHPEQRLAPAARRPIGRLVRQH